MGAPRIILTSLLPLHGRLPGDLPAANGGLLSEAPDRRPSGVLPIGDAHRSSDLFGEGPRAGVSCLLTRYALILADSMPQRRVPERRVPERRVHASGIPALRSPSYILSHCAR